MVHYFDEARVQQLLSVPDLLQGVREALVALTLGKVQLQGASKLTSGTGNIRVSDTLNGAYDLTVAAGTGTATFDKALLPPLGPQGKRLFQDPVPQRLDQSTLFRDWNEAIRRNVSIPL